LKRWANWPPNWPRPTTPIENVIVSPSIRVAGFRMPSPRPERLDE
jgi:hypothetical protein